MSFKGDDMVFVMLAELPNIRREREREPWATLSMAGCVKVSSCVSLLCEHFMGIVVLTTTDW